MQLTKVIAGCALVAALMTTKAVAQVQHATVIDLRSNKHDAPPIAACAFFDDALRSVIEPSTTRSKRAIIHAGLRKRTGLRIRTHPPAVQITARHDTTEGARDLAEAIARHIESRFDEFANEFDQFECETRSSIRDELTRQRTWHMEELAKIHDQLATQRTRWTCEDWRYLADAIMHETWLEETNPQGMAPEPDPPPQAAEDQAAWRSVEPFDSTDIALLVPSGAPRKRLETALDDDVFLRKVVRHAKVLEGPWIQQFLKRSSWSLAEAPTHAGAFDLDDAISSLRDTIVVTAFEPDVVTLNTMDLPPSERVAIAIAIRSALSPTVWSYAGKDFAATYHRLTDERIAIDESIRSTVRAAAARLADDWTDERPPSFVAAREALIRDAEFEAQLARIAELAEIDDQRRHARECGHRERFLSHRWLKRSE